MVLGDHLCEVSGSDFTAKDFRTWAGTVFVAEALLALGEMGRRLLHGRFQLGRPLRDWQRDDPRSRAPPARDQAKRTRLVHRT